MKKRGNIPEIRLQIKELHQRVEAFQEEVNKLLQSIPEGTENMGMCAECERYASDCYELSCHHLLCYSCHDYQRKHKKKVHCPLCQDYIHSSSSSEDL